MHNLLRMREAMRRQKSLSDAVGWAGFTLIELLLVIAIIAVLATIVFVNLNPGGNIIDTRNSRRVTDISTIETAIQKYSLDTGSAPVTLLTLVPAYIGAVPVDPSTNATYSYCIGTTKTSYGLGTTLETGGNATKLSALIASSSSTLPAGCTLAPALGGACGTSPYFCHALGS